MGKRLAVLSNVNVNSIIRAMKAEFEVYEPEGYGNELLLLLNPNSSYYRFAPDITFFWLDVMELIHHNLEEKQAAVYMEEWFTTLEKVLSDKGIYFISDAHLWGWEMELFSEDGLRFSLEGAFNSLLEDFCRRHGNVHVLPFKRMVAQLGEAGAYSEPMWYLGKIPYSQAMQKLQCEVMREKVRIATMVPKKVLVLDLDNTLWGGLAGEADKNPIQLSEDHAGLAYKNLQRVLKQMEEQGVMLAIASKNNEEDALAIIEKHPHMVLRKEDFVNSKINWEIKAENLRRMAAELNVGLDSFVFFDDSAVEREQIKQMLPEVAVPDFPAKPEKLPQTMVEIYHQYFEKLTVTKEDREKTAQYAANAKRQELKEKAVDMASFLKQLSIHIELADAEENLERLHQLVNKTNQFNLTTIRYERDTLAGYLHDPNKLVRLYRVTDKFGDNGIVGALIVDTSGEEPEIEEFVLSCRVMGRFIERAIVDEIEQELLTCGYRALRSRYSRTEKNKPVENLFEELGYTVVTASDAEKQYRITLENRPKREYYIA
ncbi:MAG: HAD-IIIC family phosphatase [Lachnospiraceae bacterium]